MHSLASICVSRFILSLLATTLDDHDSSTLIPTVSLIHMEARSLARTLGADLHDSLPDDSDEEELNDEYEYEVEVGLGDKYAAEIVALT